MIPPHGFFEAATTLLQERDINELMDHAMCRLTAAGQS